MEKQWGEELRVGLEMTMADEQGIAQTVDVPVVDAFGVLVGGVRWALQLTFGTPVRQGDTMIDRPKVSINMSWTLAKALRDLLADTIKAYEADEGEISVPRSFAAREAPTVTRTEEK